MRAFVVPSYNKPLTAAELDAPQVGEREVLIQVAATGLNQLDEKVRRGEFKTFLRYRAPFTLGHDVAGTVTAVGSHVTELSVGDEVYARLGDGRIGAFAEQVAARAEDVSLRPRTITAAEAASLPLVALTAWQALVEVGGVRPGQKVLVHAGSGGVGTIAIQLAKHLGASVTATASAANAQLVRDLGADLVIDYRTEKFEEMVSDYDLVLDGVGTDNVLRSLTTLKPGGIAIGISGPPTPEFAHARGLNPVLRLVMGLLSSKARRLARKRGVRYQFLFMRADGRQLAEISSLVEAGTLRPVVGRTVAFDDIPTALSEVGKDGTPGKTVAVLD